jgi:Na+/H+ antiporter NhaD/arsenite permease-like protein
MMFGATLGGNATLIGAAANIVAAGISGRHGEPISFARFASIGMPIALAQIAVSAIYVLGLWWVLRCSVCGIAHRPRNVGRRT